MYSRLGFLDTKMDFLNLCNTYNSRRDLTSVIPGGKFYCFEQGPTPVAIDIEKTLYPTITGTSVLGIKFNGGVMLASDTLGSYGSLARFKRSSRIMKVNETTILAATGDYADFQYVKSLIERKVTEDDCLNDGFSLTPQSLYSWLGRMLYNRRTKFNPFWNTFLVAGIVGGESFLGYIDKIGTTFHDDHLATGYGAYIALPLMRKAYEENPNMSQDDARNLLRKCLRVLYYRDARSLDRYEIASVTKDGAVIEPVANLDSNWDIGFMIDPKKE